MVKRTFVVLGILAMLVVGVGMANAMMFGGPAASESWVSPFPGGCGAGECPPLFVPAKCPEYPTSRTIIKTWSCKIEGPCPPPGAPAMGCGGQERPGQLCGTLLSLVGSVATPLDWLFGGCDGVYGCNGGPLGSLCGCDGPCGPGYGPVPGAIAGVLSLVSPPTVMFGCYW